MTKVEEIRRGLRDMVLEQVEKVNAVVGDQMLYVNESAGLFSLYGRPAPKALDRLMAREKADIEGFMKVWLRLDQAVKGAEV